MKATSTPAASSGVCNEIAGDTPGFTARRHHPGARRIFASAEDSDDGFKTICLTIRREGGQQPDGLIDEGPPFGQFYSLVISAFAPTPGAVTPAIVNGDAA
jgi:hypothetical protein